MWQEAHLRRLVPAAYQKTRNSFCSSGGRTYRSPIAACLEAIDRTSKKVRVRDLVTGREYEETYDKLILAPGAAPIRPPLPGIDLPGVFTLRNLQEMDRIKAKLDQGVRQAVVVAAGFVECPRMATHSAHSWHRRKPCRLQSDPRARRPSSPTPA